MTRDFKISLSQEFYSDVVYLSQYDSEYGIVFHVLDKYSKATEIDGYSAKFQGTRNDGLGFQFTSTASSDTVTFVIDTSLTAVSGTHSGEIVFYDGNGLYYGSANVQIIVEAATHSDDTIDADVTAQQTLKQELQEIVNTAATTVGANLGLLSDLTTTDKSSAVGAINEVVSDVTQLNADISELDNLVRYETEEIIAESSIQTTSGTKIDVTNSRFDASIANGSTFRFRATGSGLINRYALYFVDNGSSGRFGFNLMPNTNYEFTATSDVISLYIYIAAADVIGTGTLTLSAIDVTVNNDSIEKRVSDVEYDTNILQPLSGDKWTLDVDEFTELCVHHDNFSRTMTGFEIGMNAGGTDTGNNYDWVTPNNYDDGLTVDNGATFASGTRTYNYSLRKIVAENGNNFKIETNAPTADFPIMFGFNVTDINNFTELLLRKNNAGYQLIVVSIHGGTSQQTLVNIQISRVLAQVASLYVVRGVLYIVLDDQVCASAYIGDCGNHVYLASYNTYNVHFDFVNVFSLVSKVIWNPNYTLDTGVSNIPLKTVSAGDGNYELQGNETRWSNYADHFTLHSTDELINNGRRSEVSITNMNLFAGNLRTFKVSFDVLFPTEYVDTQREDEFVQFHDRDGTYRGTVPFALFIKDHTINVNTSSTVKPKDDNTSVITDLHRFEFCDVELGKWHHIEIECKERYEARQNPFLRIVVDGVTQFEYRKANCYNDLLGTSPQYGIYKNNWGEGVTEFQRYFDNFKIEYC